MTISGGKSIFPPMTISRRDFILNVLTGTAALSFAPATSFAKPPWRLIRTPKGVKARVLSQSGKSMRGGLIPAKPDGMTCIWGKNGEYMLLRNHELEKGEGGVTAVVVNNSLKIDDEYWALTGTARNCSGGKTSRNTWLTCEETFEVHKRRHGYVYEVDPNKTAEENSVAIPEMGRFNHEACGEHVASGYIYMTEDRPDSCFYRFKPNVKDDLKAGGTLEALVVEGEPSTAKFPQGKVVKCCWLQIDNFDPDEDVIRSEAQKRGASLFVRGEGITVSGDEIIFTCTTGGENGLGQIFSYNHATSLLEVLYQPSASSYLRKPDNLTFNQFGDLLVCEDGDGMNRVVGITQDKKVYVIASSIFGEWAGVCMSPDNKYVFANLQSMGITYAFEIDWNKIRS